MSAGPITNPGLDPPGLDPPAVRIGPTPVRIGPNPGPDRPTPPRPGRGRSAGSAGVAGHVREPEHGHGHHGARRRVAPDPRRGPRVRRGPQRAQRLDLAVAGRPLRRRERRAEERGGSAPELITASMRAADLLSCPVGPTYGHVRMKLGQTLQPRFTHQPRSGSRRFASSRRCPRDLPLPSLCSPAASTAARPTIRDERKPAPRQRMARLRARGRGRPLGRTRPPCRSSRRAGAARDGQGAESGTIAAPWRSGPSYAMRS